MGRTNEIKNRLIKANQEFHQYQRFNLACYQAFKDQGYYIQGCFLVSSYQDCFDNYCGLMIDEKVNTYNLKSMCESRRLLCGRMLHQNI